MQHAVGVEVRHAARGAQAQLSQLPPAQRCARRRVQQAVERAPGTELEHKGEVGGPAGGADAQDSEHLGVRGHCTQHRKLPLELCHR